VTFDLSEFRIVTISPLEPALILSILLASVVSWIVGKGLGKVSRLVADPWRQRLYMGPVWLTVGLGFFVLPAVLVDFIYPALHPDERHAMVCVAMVWPTFILPLTVGIYTAFRTVGAASRSGNGAAAG
jgi:hypothetical protein